MPKFNVKVLAVHERGYSAPAMVFPTQAKDEDHARIIAKKEFKKVSRLASFPDTWII